MKIKREYQIYLATERDDSRPNLSHVYIFHLFPDEGESVNRLRDLNASYSNGNGERPEWFKEWPRDTLSFLPDDTTCNGVAFATDGFVLAVVPVELEPDDVVGPIPNALMDKAFKLKKGEVNIKYEYKEYVNMVLGSDTLTLGDGSIHRRDTSVATCPDFIGIIVGLVNELQSENDGEIKRWIPYLDINYMIKVAKAMGVTVRPSVSGEGVSFLSGVSESSAIFIKHEVTPLSLLNLLKVPFGMMMPMHFGR